MPVIAILSRKSLLSTAWVLGFLFIGANLLFAAVYSGRIYPNVKVGTLNLGGMSRNEASIAMRREISSYRINLKIDSKTYEVHPSQLGASYEIDPTIDSAMSMGREDVLPLVTLITTHNIKPLSFAYTLDKDKLQAYAQKVMSEQAEAPVDATVVINDGKIAVKPDQSGLGVVQGALVSLLQQGIDTHAGVLQVHRAPVAADIQATEANAAAQAAQQIIGTVVTLKYADKQFIPTPNEIGGWLRFNKTDDGKLAITLDGDSVNAYVVKLAGGIDVAAVTKQVSVVNGEVRSSEGGLDGLAVDRDVLARALTDNLLAKKAGDIAITTVPVAFKTVYNRTVNLGDGRYVEINLSIQHLWAYDGHQVVFDSAITSGATGYGFATVEGLFAVQAKQTDRYLDGRLSPYPYYVHVDYWMPFYGDYGMHDASWRAAFGGQDYYYQGSHGCVNLPAATAAWLYNFVSVGTPVWVHE